ncbi:MAG: SPASM domain-containing protein [Bacteroidales bacterium]|nr:SPASM domain-containing protein [Bacteroidales bacterium]
MKLSIYTTFFEVASEKYIYNSYTNSLVKVDDKLYVKLYTLKNKNFTIQELGESDEIILDLRKARIVIENLQDDFLQYQAITWGRRKISNVYNITIAPTMDCNFHCYYCFEQPEKEYMSDGVIEKIVTYINNIRNCKRLNLTWFGGEPLLALQQITKITNKIRLSSRTSKDFCIITNGYYLTKEVTDNLNNLQIDSIQLTVDGLFDDYNQVKNMKDNKNCFNVFLNNLDYFAEKQKDIRLNIRVNIEKNIKNKFLDIASFFIKRYPNNYNILPYPAFLKNICNTTKQSQACMFCDTAEKMEFSIDLFHKTGNKDFLYPGNAFSECAVRNENSWAFGPDGSVYKCWENIGNKSTKIGHLNEKGEIIIDNYPRLLRYLYGADPLSHKDCKQCFYLPICFGGCPHQRILEEFENAPVEPCAKDNGYIERYLTEIINYQNQIK